MKWILIGALVLAGVLIVVVVIGALLPKQHMASRSIALNASPEAVWSLISGPPAWRPDVKSYQELPSQNGHRMWRETDKHGQTITYEAIETSAPTRLVTKIADPKLPFGGTWTFEILRTRPGFHSRLRRMVRSTIRCSGSFHGWSWDTQRAWMRI